eukprot:1228858-Pleurochrysis_carterae.AAC.1
MKSWTGELMNQARIHMKLWTEKKNEHKAVVQRRWDNRGKMLQMFMRWRRKAGYRQNEQESPDGEKEKMKADEVDRGEKEKTYGIKYWGRVRAIPRIHLRVKNFLQKGVGTPEAYILARGALILSYLTEFQTASAMLLATDIAYISFIVTTSHGKLK